jgi:hypothetical protein
LLEYKKVCTREKGRGAITEYIYRGRGEIGVSALSAGAYTTALVVMVDRMKVVGRAPPTLTRLGLFCHVDGMYARKWLLPLCVYSVEAID